MGDADYDLSLDYDEISRCLSPLNSRYLPRDDILREKLVQYRSLGVFSKIRRIVSDVLVPRLQTVEQGLDRIIDEYGKLKVPKRIDGRNVGETTVQEVWSEYKGRLRTRRIALENLPVVFVRMSESWRNDRMSDLVYCAVSALSVQANVANDIRHLTRSEIEEVKLHWDANRVGSSTMPHKMNPASFENIVSFWKHHVPKVTYAVMSQITEHQGDSTNSEFPYGVFETLGGICYITRAMANNLQEIRINSLVT